MSHVDHGRSGIRTLITLPLCSMVLIFNSWRNSHIVIIHAAMERNMIRKDQAERVPASLCTAPLLCQEWT